MSSLGHCLHTPDVNTKLFSSQILFLVPSPVMSLLSFCPWIPSLSSRVVTFPFPILYSCFLFLFYGPWLPSAPLSLTLPFPSLRPVLMLTAFEVQCLSSTSPSRSFFSLCVPFPKFSFPTPFKVHSIAITVSSYTVFFCSNLFHLGSLSQNLRISS